MDHKFRVWDINRKEMYRPHYAMGLSWNKNSGTDLVSELYRSNGSYDCSDDPNETVIMYSSGIEDVENIDVYDGDILEGKLDRSSREGTMGGGPIRVRIVQLPGGFVYTQDLNLTMPDALTYDVVPLAMYVNRLALSKCKIIGNAYENPDLLV